MGFHVKKTLLSDRQGFTLLEALVAIAVLAVVMLGTATMLFSGLSTSAGSNNRYTATTIAQSTVENLMATQFDNLTSQFTPVVESKNGIEYKTKWRIEKNPTNIRYVNISTNWKDKAGSHGISISSARAR